jgi:hypothetical protein
MVKNDPQGATAADAQRLIQADYGQVTTVDVTL